MRDMGSSARFAGDCIVLTRDGIENGPLRFADEFVRTGVGPGGRSGTFGQADFGNVVATVLSRHAHRPGLRILRDKTLWRKLHTRSGEEAPTWKAIPKPRLGLQPSFGKNSSPHSGKEWP